MRGSIAQRFAAVLALGTLCCLAVVCGGCTAPNSMSPAEGQLADGKADGTSVGLESASEMILEHTFLSENEYYRSHPQAAAGHIKEFDCHRGSCTFMYFTSDSAFHSRYVTATLEILEKDRATDTCSTVTEVPGHLEVTVSSDQLGGYDYAYAYRWTYRCSTNQLDIGAREAAELDTLDRLH